MCLLHSGTNRYKSRLALNIRVHHVVKISQVLVCIEIFTSPDFLLYSKYSPRTTLNILSPTLTKSYKCHWHLNMTKSQVVLKMLKSSLALK